MTPAAGRPETRETGSSEPRPPWVRLVSPWVLSVLFHAAVIVVLASIVLVGTSREPIEAVLSLETVERVVQPSEAEETGDGASGGAPSRTQRSDATRADATAAPMPAAPMPADLGAALAETPQATPTVDPASADPAFAVLAELAEQPEAERVTGRGLNPLLEGTSPGFQEMVGGVRGAGLDVVIVLDATDSMAPYIGEAKRRIHDVIGVITGVLSTDGKPPTNVRFGLVAYKDYGDDFGLTPTRALPLTGDFDAVRHGLDQIFVGGGGDEPEPVHEALAAATDARMGWRNKAVSVIVLVTDAPVHSSGRRRALSIAAAFARRYDGRIDAIDVGRERETVLADLANIAAAGNGSAFRLADVEAFWQELIVSIFGTRFENDVEQIVRRYAKKE